MRTDSVTVEPPPSRGATACVAIVRTPEERVSQVHDSPGTISVTVQVAVESLGCVMRATLPTASGVR